MIVEALESKDNETCVWSGIFDAKASETLDKTQYSTGIITVVFGMFLSGSVVTSKLFADGSYRNLTNYTVAAALRRSTPGLIYVLPSLKRMYSWQKYSFLACDFFGFWETFFGVFEIESLTMICIERYVVAKYHARGWRVPRSHYYLYGSLCVFFAFSYAYPPVLGIGRFANDFDCTHCTFDMVLPPDGWKKYLIVFIFFMRSIKPSIMMLLMLYWAYNLEIQTSDNQAQRQLTKGVAAAACSYILCGIPITLIRGWVILSQLIYGEIVKFPENVISTAMTLHWSSPAFAMFGLTVCDPHLRHQLIDIITNDEPETNARRNVINDSNSN